MWTLYEWGKRKNVLHERELMVSMTQLKVHQTQDEVRLKALKAYREVDQQREAVKMGSEMVELRKVAEKAAAPMAAVKARMLAEVDLVKSGLAYHVACTQLSRLTGCEP